MLYRVTHTTRYSYSEAVPLCQNELHLTPRDSPRQTCHEHRLTVLPVPHRIDNSRDYFGNHVNFFTISEGHYELSVTAESQISVEAEPRPLPDENVSWEAVRDAARESDSEDSLWPREFVFASPHIPLDPRLESFAAEYFAPGRPWLEAVLDLMAHIHDDFTYDPTATSISTPLEMVLAMRRGVCQDFAHLQIGCLRALGLPARYVSGYLLTMPPPGKPRLVGADASHAWLAGWCPGAGWVDFDPTNNVVPSIDHVTLAWGRDYSDVCPIKGVFIGGGNHSMQVGVDVEPLDNGQQ